MRQAQTWETNKGRGLNLGPCEKCAAQYAWGIQIGFTMAKPPCNTCQALMAELPGRNRLNEWRR
jgi:hypothetical protein